MKPVRINAGEAFFECFYDPDLSELSAWEVRDEGEAGLNVRQKNVLILWFRPHSVDQHVLVESVRTRPYTTAPWPAAALIPFAAPAVWSHLAIRLTKPNCRIDRLGCGIGKKIAALELTRGIYARHGRQRPPKIKAIADVVADLL